jgi:hypothetical protein
MVVTNRRGDLIIPRPRPHSIKKDPVVHRPRPHALAHIKSANPFWENTLSVPRPTPIAVTQAMQLNTTSKNKADVMPSNKMMSKKKKAAIIGGSVGAMLAAWGAYGKGSQYLANRKQQGLNDELDQKMADSYKEIEPFLKGNGWEKNLKSYYDDQPLGGKFFENTKDLGLEGATKNLMQGIAHPTGSGEMVDAEEFFDVVSDIVH